MFYIYYFLCSLQVYDCWVVTPLGADEEADPNNIPTSGHVGILLSLSRPQSLLLQCGNNNNTVSQRPGCKWDRRPHLKAYKTVFDIADRRFNHPLKIQFQGDILMGTFITNNTTEKNYSKTIPLILPTPSNDL